MKPLNNTSYKCFCNFEKGNDSSLLVWVDYIDNIVFEIRLYIKLDLCIYITDKNLNMIIHIIT